MIKIQSFTFNPFMENTYVLYDETKEAIVIDPGCYESQEHEVLKRFITDQSLKVTLLLNTHGHVDHVLGNSFVKKEYDVPFLIHEADRETLRSVEVYAPGYGFPSYEPCTPDHFINETKEIRFGNSTLKVMFLPGHAPGHVAFYNETEKICIGGDVLFKGSIGRTDLPGGDFDTLIHSIQTKLFKLDDDMVVYPGHGPETTLGEEKRTNPFCAID